MYCAATRSGHRSTCRLRFPIRGGLACWRVLEKKRKKKHDTGAVVSLVIGCDRRGTLTWPN